MSAPRTPRGKKPKSQPAPSQAAPSRLGSIDAGGDLPTLVEKLAAVLRHNDLSEIVVDSKDLTLRLSRNAAPTPSCARRHQWPYCSQKTAGPAARIRS